MLYVGGSYKEKYGVASIWIDEFWDGREIYPATILIDVRLAVE
jgi:hypothetical protein